MTYEFVYAGVCTVPSSNPLLPAVIILGVVVLLLITCVALLVLALAVTATKLNRLRAEKGHTDPAHYYDQTERGKAKVTKDVRNEVGEKTASTGGQMGLYQELELEAIEERQYEGLTKNGATAKAKAGQ